METTKLDSSSTTARASRRAWSRAGLRPESWDRDPPNRVHYIAGRGDRRRPQTSAFHGKRDAVVRAGCGVPLEMSVKLFNQDANELQAEGR